MIEPGTRVEIEDPNVDPGSYGQATVVAAAVRTDIYAGREVAGWTVQFDNGSEEWVNDWRVREMRTVAVSRRDLEQILTAMENRGDHRNNDPQWRDLYERLHAVAVAKG